MVKLIRFQLFFADYMFSNRQFLLKIFCSTFGIRIGIVNYRRATFEKIVVSLNS